MASKKNSSEKSEKSEDVRSEIPEQDEDQGQVDLVVKEIRENGSGIFELECPYDFGSEKVVSFEFRKPNAGDMWDLPVGNMTAGNVMEIASRCSGEPIKKLKKMEMSDALSIIEVISSFLTSGQ